MPKSAKKRKDKAADFTKAKLKLGKGKQAASNAIDTSFKARSIALPTQSITTEKDANVPTTKRRLTFDELVAHAKHYSAGTRKEAILGFRELFEAHRELLDSSLTALFNACVRMIGDEDAGVRKGLLTFFGWLLPKIPEEKLIPHSSSLLLFTTSAQTHIFPEIRIDAVRFLNLLLDRIPQTVVAGWADDEDRNSHSRRILEGYLGILNANSRFNEAEGSMDNPTVASIRLIPTSKLIVLQSLSSFLKNAISPLNTVSSASMNTWYLLPSFTTSEAYNAFDKLLQPSPQSNVQSWHVEVDPEDCDNFAHNYSLAQISFSSHWIHEHQSNSTSRRLTDAEVSHVTRFTSVSHLARTLHATLSSVFLDCAPGIFSPSETPNDTEVQLVVVISQIIRTLYGAILHPSSNAPEYYHSACEDLGTMLEYMATYFPFRPTSRRDIKIEEAFQDLNLIFCELTSLMVHATQNVADLRPRPTRQIKPGRTQRRKPSSLASSLSAHTHRVSEYVIQLLTGEEAFGSQLNRPLTSSAYLALLPTIWALINNPTLNQKEISVSVLQATVKHALKVPAKSALKRYTVEFISRLILLEKQPQYQGTFTLGQSQADDQMFEEWVIDLPKSLWELACSDLRTTETILRFLLRMLQCKSRQIHSKTLSLLQLRLSPYFMHTHAARGQVLGPYSKLPTSPLRHLALAVVAFTLSIARCNDLQHAVAMAVLGTKEQDYWEHINVQFR